jgi:hypothetical protein
MKFSFHSLIPFLQFLLNYSAISPDNSLLTWNSGTRLTKVKVKVTLRLTASQSVSLGVEPHLVLMTRYLLLFDSYGLFFFVGRPLWREDGSVFCICCWSLPAQFFLGTSPLLLATIFYFLRFETFLFVVSYDSQGHGGGTRPHMGSSRKHGFQQLCLPIRCLETASSIVACVFVVAGMYLPTCSLETCYVTLLFIRLLHINGCTCYSINPAKAVLKRLRCRVLIQNDVTEYLDTCRDLTRGASFACAQFNFAMEKGVERTGRICMKYVRLLLLVCRDDIYITGRSYERLKTPSNRQSWNFIL